MELDDFRLLPSWTVNYLGAVFDDARQDGDGAWHCRDIATRRIEPFTFQDRVIPICKNPIDPLTNI
jgi:hypothetical protein